MASASSKLGRPKFTARAKYTLQWALILLCAGFYFKEVAVIYLGLFLIVLLALCYVICWRNFCLVSIKREMPEELFANSEFTVYLSVKIERYEPLFCLSLKDYFLPEKKSSFLIPQVENDWHKCGQVRMKIPNRGIYREADCLISADFPLGFFKIEKKVKSALKLIVYPEPLSHDEELELGKGQENEAEREILASSNNMGSFRGLREFMPGDPVKLISWSATARSGSVMVREMEPPEPERFIVIFHSAKFKNVLPDKKQFERCLRLLSGIFLSLQEEGRSFEFFSGFSNWQAVVCDNPAEIPASALALLAAAQFGESDNFNEVVRIVSEMPIDYHAIIVSPIPVDIWQSKLPEVNNYLTCVDGKNVVSVGVNLV